MGISKFDVIAGRGFHMTFENGWTVSVMFGAGSYSDNYGIGFLQAVDILQCANAEVAVFKRGKPMYRHPYFDNGTVSSDYTPKMVLDLMTWAEALDPDFDYDSETSENEESE